jgi:hypothetical protein
MASLDFASHSKQLPEIFLRDDQNEGVAAQDFSLLLFRRGTERTKAGVF